MTMAHIIKFYLDRPVTVLSGQSICTDTINRTWVLLDADGTVLDRGDLVVVKAAHRQESKSIKDTLALIESTPDNDEIGCPTAWFALDNRCITTADLKSLAAYIRKLQEAK
jgi:hypothetical protein